MSQDEHNQNAAQILLDLKRVHELVRHVHHVQSACMRMGEKLIEEGESEFGRNLIANSFIHDQSKFRGIEWESLACRDSQNKDAIPLAILNHQKSNPHHPEYWGGITKMPEIYLAEMVADWWARSIEMGTDFREWVGNTAPSRFGFVPGDEIYTKITRFMLMILDEPFK